MTPDQLSKATGKAHGRMGSRRRRVFATAALAVMALTLGACSAGSHGSASNGASGSAEGKPKRGGTLRLTMSNGSAADTLDPVNIRSTNGFVLVGSIYDQLAVFGDNFAAKPWLAESWKPSADAKTWTIKLRSGVKWQDGTPLTAKDVVYTMKRWLDKTTGGTMYGFMNPVLSPEGVTAPDDLTVVLHLKAAQGTLMQTFANLPYSSIVKDGTTDFSTAIGTGPFKVKDFTPGQGWKLTRNENYWAGPAYLDAIQGTIVPDQSAKVQALLAGSADVTDLIPTSLLPTLKGNSNVSLVPIKNQKSWIFAFDQRKAPFDNPKVLEALKLGTNREQILKTALQGAGTVIADIPVDPSTKWYPAQAKPEYNVAKAKALLAEAGFANGLDIELALTDSVPGMLDAAQAWQQAVKDAGVRVTLKQFPADTYYVKGWGAAPAFVDTWTNFFPPVGLNAFYVEGAPLQLTKKVDPEVGALTAKLNAATELDQQIAYAQQAYLKASKSYSYIIPVFADAEFGTAPNVRDVGWTVASFDFRKTWMQ